MYSAELSRLGINLKNNHHGQIKTTCPWCSSTRKKPNEDCLSVNIDEGVYNCKHCGKKGSVAGRQYTTPKAPKNLSEKSEDVYALFAARKITKETVDHFKVGVDAKGFSRTDGLDGVEIKKTVCFPYYLNGVLVNVKYKTADKRFKMTTGALKVPFNIDAIKDHDYVIFVEGEEDAMVWHQCGYPSVVSCPNGATKDENNLTWLDEVYDLFEDKRIFLATDMDAPGEKLKKDLTRRFPIDLVYTIEYPEKDANETLKEHGDIFGKLFSEAQPVPMKEIGEVKDFRDQIFEYHKKGYPVGSKLDVRSVDELMSWAPGELMAVTGIPSHGKSTWLNWAYTRLAYLRDWKIGIFSPEHTASLAITRLCEQFIGKALTKMNDKELKMGLDFVQDHFIFYNVDELNDFTMGHLLDLAKTMIRRYGIRAICFDPYTYIENNEGGDSNTDRIGKLLVNLKKFAVKNDVLVTLVAHPRKMERLGQGGANYVVPKLYDIAGSNNFYNTIDVGVIIYREFREATEDNYARIVVEKIKQHFRGRRGHAELQFDVDTGVYYESGGAPMPTYKLLKEENINPLL